MYDPASDPKKFRSLRRAAVPGRPHPAVVRLLHVEHAQGRAAGGRRRIAACCSIRRSMRALNIRGTASTQVPRPTRIRCNWRNSCCRPTATASCSSGRTTSIPMNPIGVMGDFVAQGTGKVLDEIYVPLEPRRQGFREGDRGSRRPRPDVIFSTVVGGGTSTLYERLSQRRLRSGQDADREPDDQRSRSRGDGIARPPRDTSRRRLSSRRCRRRRRVVSWTNFKDKYGADAPVTGGCRGRLFSASSGDAGGREMRVGRSGTEC